MKSYGLIWGALTLAACSGAQESAETVQHGMELAEKADEQAGEDPVD